MKKWYLSKTLWVNIIAVVAMAIQNATGYELSPEMQVYILAGINFLLRIITKEELV